ncbi:OapA N-terminal domain-containing protein [Shigella flexneri]|nr:OapA N-terminal domain-containing protein [Shigella flexneri]MDD0163303.1 OapA N-terminal domain-containing protein [Shigella flexneri]MDD0171338.1 OapA N-terminal domain-containing protein [Shigella flexneri]MDD0219828.1 OapA N-terminal domain-containing protein [Shigella flexneri]MDD0268756.1 OapA N-terminal domain-containing protein [Shigella flexneri]
MEQEETMPGRFELKPTLEKVWHAPDNFRFMDPLPPMHRRGIIIAADASSGDHYCRHCIGGRISASI